MIRVTVDKSDDETWECNACGARAWTEIEAGPSRDWRVLYLCDSCLVEMRAKLFPVLDPGQVGGGKVGRRHPDQSRHAAAIVKAGSQLAALLNIVYYRGHVGSTSAEAAVELSDVLGHIVSRNQTAARMLELRERGLVEAGTVDGDPEKRTTSAGAEGQVWVVTDLGLTELRRIHS